MIHRTRRTLQDFGQIIGNLYWFVRGWAAYFRDAAFDAFTLWCKSHGILRLINVDKHGIYRGEGGVATQLGRAMEELCLELKMARSRQAKGRVEHRNRLFQDRFVKEVCLRQIKTMTHANV